MKINYQLDNGAFAPMYAHAPDAGADLRSPDYAVVPAHGSVIIDTGVHVEIPVGYAGVLMSKSGLNVNHSITSEGLIDAGYTGSIVVKLYNHGSSEYIVRKGDKITQLVITAVPAVEFEPADVIHGLERGNKGFGSTGR